MSERLIDMVDHLPSGTRLSTTPEFERVLGRKLSQVSIMQACSAVIAAGYQDKEAEWSSERKTIKVYAGGKWIPWPALLVQTEGEEAVW
jgi:hypothetical protein